MNGDGLAPVAEIELHMTDDSIAMVYGCGVVQHVFQHHTISISTGSIVGMVSDPSGAVIMGKRECGNCRENQHD